MTYTGFYKDKDGEEEFLFNDIKDKDDAIDRLLEVYGIDPNRIINGDSELYVVDDEGNIIMRISISDDKRLITNVL